MSHSSKNKPLQRIKLILEFIKSCIEKNPHQETFTFPTTKLESHDPLLSDRDLMRDTFAEIQKETGQKVKIEYRTKDSGTVMTATEGNIKNYQTELWFYVEDPRKLGEYYNQTKKEIERDNSTYNLILDDEQNLYLEGGSSKNVYALRGEDNLRYNLILYLAEKKKYVSTQELAEKLFTTKIKVGKTIGQVRNMVHKKIKIPREAIFESDHASGYRILNVVFKGAKRYTP